MLFRWISYREDGESNYTFHPDFFPIGRDGSDVDVTVLIQVCVGFATSATRREFLMTLD